MLEGQFSTTLSTKTKDHLFKTSRWTHVGSTGPYQTFRVVLTVKTVLTIVEFRGKPAPPDPVFLQPCLVDSVKSFQFLVIIISRNLKQQLNMSSFMKKQLQSMYFLQQLKKFNLLKLMMVHFYSSITVSILTSSITI